MLHLIVYIFILLGWLQKIIFFVMTFFSQKAKKSYEGRLQNERFYQSHNSVDFQNCIWFHTASLGEFEQVRYLIEKIKSTSPQSKIVVTFFSVSGFEPQQNFKFADAILYLPFENKTDIHAFLDFFQPKKVIWVRYEFWPLIISSIAKRNIPLILLNGVFRSSYSPFYRPILKFCLQCFAKLYVVDMDSKMALQKMHFESEVLADTRFERMQAVKEKYFEDEKISSFIDNNPCLIVGSSWPNDEELLLEIMPNFPSLKIILAPHEVHNSRIEELKKRFSEVLFYSQYRGEKTGSNILVVDSIGMLSKLYRFGTINYVGGGFNKVVHSLLEPMAYGKPIIIGKNIAKSAEALRLVKEKWVVQVYDTQSFKLELDRLLHKDNSDSIKARITYFESHLGSVSKIINDHILK